MNWKENLKQLDCHLFSQTMCKVFYEDLKNGSEQAGNIHIKMLAQLHRFLGRRIIGVIFLASVDISLGNLFRFVNSWQKFNYT